MLVMAIWNQEESCLAREVLTEQVRMGWPGLGTEVRAICQEIGIEDVTQEECRIDKEEVKEAIRLNHLQNMKEAMQGEKLRAMAMTDMRDRRPYT